MFLRILFLSTVLITACRDKTGPSTKADRSLSIHEGVTCNEAVSKGTLVRELQIAKPLPVPLGGTLTSGTYVMVERSIYTGAGGATGATDIQEGQTAYVTVDGDVATAQIVRIGHDAGHKTLRLIFSKGAKEFIVQQTCPGHCDDCGGPQPYSATPDSLLIIGDGPNHSRTRFFKKLAK